MLTQLPVSAMWWVPPMPGNHNLDKCRKICGLWIRDEPIDDGFRYWQYPSVELSRALQAFRHGETTDKALDPAVFSTVEIQDPLTTESRLTELPTEIIQQIFTHLLPSGCAFQFFPARMTGSTISVPCVQRFVLEDKTDHGDSLLCWADCPCHTHRDPSTGSAYLAIAATCRRLQDEAYTVFYSQNTFVFHLTTCAIRTEMRCSGPKNIRAWSRRLPQNDTSKTKDQHTGLSPLTPLAIAYLRKVLLIPSTPPAPTSKDLTQLTGLMEHVCAFLRHARLKSLTIDFQQPLKSTSTDKRFALTVLTIDSLEVEVNQESGLSVVSRDHRITYVRERNRTQQVLVPLLNVQGAFPKTEKLILSGFLSERMESDLKEAFAGSLSRAQDNGQALTELSDGTRARKRKRL